MVLVRAWGNGKPVDGMAGMAWPAWLRSGWQQGIDIVPMLGKEMAVEREQKGKAESGKVNGKTYSDCTAFHKDFTAFHKDFSSVAYIHGY